MTVRNSTRAGRPMTIKKKPSPSQKKAADSVCPYCYTPTTHGAYCTPEHELIHQRLRGTA